MEMHITGQGPREALQSGRAETEARPSILIVEDEPGPREALKVILRPFYRLYAVDRAEAALELLEDHQVDLITLDLKLPGMQGTDLLKQIKDQDEDIEVVIITGYGGLQSALEGLRRGVSAYLLKPFNVTELIEVLNRALQKKQRLARFKEFSKTAAHLLGSELTPEKIWDGFGPLLEHLQPELLRHSSRVHFYATLLASELGLRSDERKTLEIGAYLHDIGKIGSTVSAHLSASGSSGLAEIVQQHTIEGSRMVLWLPLPHQVGEIIRHHHECFDGSGYPDGLGGERIPFLARIVGIANLYDHLVTEEYAGQEDPGARAKAHLLGQRGRQIDPELTDGFLKVIG